MKKISNYIIISDVDGTLLPTNKPIPKRNIDALNRFVANGGRFGIATGRSKETTEEFVKTLPVNAPCVLYNGGALYDFRRNEFLMQSFLPDSARVDLKKINIELPWLSIMVVTGDKYNRIVNSDTNLTHFSGEWHGYHRSASLEELTEPWYKAIFPVTAEEADMFASYIKENTFEGVRFVRSAEMLFEILPAASTKGHALQKLAELEHFSQDNIAAIGDYYNDVEMIRFAAIGVTTAEAPDDIKAIADFVTGPCELGAVADLVEYLESICG